MAKNLISPGQGLRRIMSREIAPIYTLLGEDYFFQDLIVGALSDYTISNDGERFFLIMGVDSEEKLLDHMNLNSLFSQKSIIVVKNSKKIKAKFQSEIIDYCNSPSNDKIIIFIYNDPYATNKFIDQICSLSTCVDTRTPFPNKMKEWVKYYSKKNEVYLTNQSIDQLVENYGDNLNNIMNEIDKIYIQSNGDSEQISSLVSSNVHKKENQIWKLLDSIGRKDAATSIDIYSQLYNNNVPVIRILLNLLDLFKELINQKINAKEGKFIRNKIILRNLNIYGNKFSIEEILNAILLLRNCDLTVKTTSINETHLFHSIVAEICEGMRA